MNDRLIFAADYEGSYRILPGHPPEKEVAAVREFRSKGHLFGIITERDAFETWANGGEYDDEYDFIVCSGGGCVISRLPVGGVNCFTRLFTETAHPYFLTELNVLFESVGADFMTADVFSFRGGNGDGERFKNEYDRAKGIGCLVHYWAGGSEYYHNDVNRDALSYVTPFSQCSAMFRNIVTAEGVAGEINRRYRGCLRAFTSGTRVIVVPASANRASGIAKFAEFAGVPAENIWAFGSGSEDVGMLTRFKGIAKKGGHPAVLAATERAAGSVKEALEMALGE